MYVLGNEVLAYNDFITIICHSLIASLWSFLIKALLMLPRSVVQRKSLFISDT